MSATDSQQRPASATVFGVLNIVFGIAGLCCTIGIVGLMPLMEEFLQRDPFSARMTELRNEPVLRTVTTVGAGLDFIAAIVLATAGFGLLSMRPWARIVSLVHAVYAIVTAMAATLLNHFLLYQPMLAEAAPGSSMRSQAVFNLVLGIMLGASALIYPVCILYFLTRPKLIAALNDPSSLVSGEHAPSGPTETGNPYQSPR